MKGDMNMKTMKRIFSLVVVLMLVLLAVTPAFAASTPKLNKTKATVSVGMTTTLKVSGTTGKVTWSSSNKAVAQVSSKGVVQANKAGTAVITAKVGGRKLTCKITVKSNVFKTSKTPYNVNISGVAVTFHVQKMVFDKNQNLIVKGFFTNPLNRNVYRLQNYRINIYVNGKCIASAFFNMNVFIPANGWYSTTLTFPKSCTRIMDLTKGTRYVVLEGGTYIH